MKRIVAGVALAGAVAAAGAGYVYFGTGGGGEAVPATPHFAASGYPEHLSAWGVVSADGRRLVLGQGVLPYDLATPLFTDYAGKLRTVYVPKGQAARYDATQSFDFPVGTIISKTFYYPLPEAAAAADGTVLRAPAGATQSGAQGLDLSHLRLVETRVLARRDTGWVALPYVWNEDQTDATLARTGELIPLTLQAADGHTQHVDYAVPNVNQCAACHTPNHASRQLSPIGPKARHLNKIFPYADGAENQIAHWQRIGLLTGAPAPDAAPRNADYRDANASLTARARAYLDINCAHCHSSEGLARTTGLQLDANITDDRHLGFCKPPVAAGPGTGNHIFDIVPGKPDDSIVVYRLTSDKPGIRMPEAGRTVTHDEGVALIRQWITSLTGTCAS